jgi:hypothetical protein
VKRVKVRGYRTYAVIEGEHVTWTIWGWRCNQCNQADGSTWSWNEAYAEAVEHAKTCAKKPVQLVYAIRLPGYTWYTDPTGACGIAGSGHEAAADEPPGAVKYMDFPPDTPRDIQAAVAVHTPVGMRIMDMTVRAAMKYREEWCRDEAC